jgi:hypothetical protein
MQETFSLFDLDKSQSISSAEFEQARQPVPSRALLYLYSTAARMC